MAHEGVATVIERMLEHDSLDYGDLSGAFSTALSEEEKKSDCEGTVVSMASSSSDAIAVVRYPTPVPMPVLALTPKESSSQVLEEGETEAAPDVEVAKAAEALRASKREAAVTAATGVPISECAFVFV